MNCPELQLRDRLDKSRNFELEVVLHGEVASSLMINKEGGTKISKQSSLALLYRFNSFQVSWFTLSIMTSILPASPPSAHPKYGVHNAGKTEFEEMKQIRSRPCREPGVGDDSVVGLRKARNVVYRSAIN